MAEFEVTRANLKNACDDQNWDLFDKLLEISTEHIDDNALYTDTWGTWWGLLLECISHEYEDGVRVLLKHGANRDRGSWGDCDPTTPLEAASNNPVILALLTAATAPLYVRNSEPPLPMAETEEDQAVNQQGEVRKRTGMVFQTQAFRRSDL